MVAHRSRWSSLVLPLALVLASACGGGADTERRDGGVRQLTELLDQASVRSRQAPTAAREQLRWAFHQPQPGWRPLDTRDAAWVAPVGTQEIDDALRLHYARPAVQRSMLLIGGLRVDLDPELRLGDWEAVHIRARSRDRFAGITAAHNLETADAVPRDMLFFFSTDEAPPVFNDGSEQVYAIPLRPHEDETDDTPLTSVAVVAATLDASDLDILSIELVPRGAAYLDDHGVRHVVRDGETRATLFTHTPSRVACEVVVPEGGRLDVGLSAEIGESVTYRVGAAAGSEAPSNVFEETIDDAATWTQRSIDLSPWAGRTTTLTLETSSASKGSVGLWGAPILSGSRRARRPDVIFYVIDGGGGDLMSLYGYNRRTTPFLEQLADEGAVFDRAFSNSTWTQPSTVSFMTSLHHSVLGGLRRGVHSTPVPAGATTMAEHFRAAGYQTASFGANPNAGRIIGLERGVDVMRDGGVEHHSTSSGELHDAYWWFRRAYPGTPSWVHVQTTDVHEPNEPVPPFAGLYISPEERERLHAWDQQIFRVAGAEFGRTSIMRFYDVALERAEIDRQAYFGARRDLYDETMAHQDHQLARLVERLKAQGRWENTLLVVGSDHGHPAGSFARWGRGLFDPQPEPWQGALFDAYASRVPLVFVWPGHIPGGQRFDQAVSMIDVLPTLLDLLDLPRPEVLQGQSLAPLLLGRSQEVRPVILDEFRIDDETGEMIGNLEIVDGRWGASLEIGPQVQADGSGLGRHAVPIGGRWGAVHPHYPNVPKLLLYDLWKDPFARRAVNDEHPELVTRYGALLREQWRAHRALAERFGEAGEVALTPEQLEQLRSLGYIQ